MSIQYPNSMILAAALSANLLLAQGSTETVSPLPTGNSAINEYNKEYLVLTRTIVSPKAVADAFGRRIGRRYIALQITIANRNSEYQWLVTDASADLSRLIGYMNSSSTCSTRATSLMALTRPTPNPTVTGSDLTVLRGVAEKGQDLDPRNLTLRILEGSGTIAAGLLGVTTFGPAFAPSVAAFNGPLVNAFARMFPDRTVNQMNRLNDSAYTANTLVPKQQARVLVIFIPADILLTSQEQNLFYRDANSVYSSCVDLRLLDAYMNGHYVTQLNVGPVITGITIPSMESAKFASDNFKVSGTITGRFLDGATVSLDGAPVGLTIAATGKGTAEVLTFELSAQQPVSQNAPITIQVSKPGMPVTSHTITANYTPAAPTISAGGVSPSSVKQGEQKTIEITGTNFLPGARPEFTNSIGLTIGDIEYVSTTKLKVSVGAASDAATGPREFVIRVAGVPTGKALVTVEAK